MDSGGRHSYLGDYSQWGDLKARRRGIKEDPQEADFTRMEVKTAKRRGRIKVQAARPTVGLRVGGVRGRTSLQGNEAVLSSLHHGRQASRRFQFKIFTCPVTNHGLSTCYAPAPSIPGQPLLHTLPLPASG